MDFVIPFFSTVSQSLSYLIISALIIARKKADNKVPYSEPLTKINQFKEGKAWTKIRRMHIYLKMGVYSCARGLIDYFIYREKHMRKLPNQIMQELEDFWDVYSEFDHMLRPGIKRNILILQMI